MNEWLCGRRNTCGLCWPLVTFTVLVVSLGLLLLLALDGTLFELHGERVEGELGLVLRLLRAEALNELGMA